MNRGSDPRESVRDAAATAHCVIVAGPNGAGKTTASHALVTERHGIQRIVNPDAIAVGLAGVAELGALPAGKLALEAQRRYVSERADFAMETTLSGRRWARFLDALILKQYRVSLYFLWMPDPALCVARVQSRVMLGGHGIPEADILRRYESGLHNLRDVFIPLVDDWQLYDATARAGTRRIAQGGRGRETHVSDDALWQRVRHSWESGQKNALPHDSTRGDTR